MKSRPGIAVALAVGFALSTVCAVGARAGTATEYSQHFGALRKLSVAVAEAMPPEQYTFRPDAGSMSFGEVIAHIAATNYAFCAGLNDSTAPRCLHPAIRTRTLSSNSSTIPSSIAPA